MSLEDDFTEFWRAYPRKVGKLAAKKVYLKVRRSGTTQDELLDGIAEYRRHKPAYADFCHAQTWLNGGRWMDEFETQPAWSCPHQPPCGETPFRCHQRWHLDQARKARQA